MQSPICVPPIAFAKPARAQSRPSEKEEADASPHHKRGVRGVRGPQLLLLALLVPTAALKFSLFRRLEDRRAADRSGLGLVGATGAMSLNTADSPGGIVLFAGELILLYTDGVQITCEGPCAQGFKGLKSGRLYLTTHRMIFFNSNTKDAMRSFSLPFVNVSDLQLKQPLFGANYIQGTVKAEPNGNWSGTCDFKLYFNKGGAIEFGRAMMSAMNKTNQYRVDVIMAPAGGMGVLQAAPPGTYMAPPGANYGFQLPYNVFPSAPPANSVFVGQAPPPYPGVTGPPPQPGVGVPVGGAQGASYAFPATQQQQQQGPPPAGFKEQPGGS